MPHYQPWLRSAKLDTRRALHKIADIDSVLLQFGVFSVEQIRLRPHRSIKTPVVFASPLSPGVSPDLLWNADGCIVLDDPGSTMHGHRALFIRIGLDEGLLSPIERDGLWQRHGVPMFEHLVGMDGELLAWECETHSGLHIMQENAIFEVVEGELLLTSLTDLLQPTIQMRTGWSGHIEKEPCDCGRPGPRILDLRERSLQAGLDRKLAGFAIAAAS
jgi:hypothetical protein